MGALTPGRSALRILIRDNERRLWRRPGLPVSCHRTVRSFRLQPPVVVPTRLLGFALSGLPDPIAVVTPFRVVRHLGFAINSLARHDDRPNRVHLCYGLIVHLRLLSTPPHGDAVTIGTGFQTTPARTFTLLIRSTYRRTSPGFSRSGNHKTGLS